MEGPSHGYFVASDSFALPSSPCMVLYFLSVVQKTAIRPCRLRNRTRITAIDIDQDQLQDEVIDNQGNDSKVYQHSQKYHRVGNIFHLEAFHFLADC